MKDYYQILGVEEDAGEETIRSRYRSLAMEYHPDRNPDDPQAEDKFKEIAEAYGVLTDPVKRKEYDTWRNIGGPRSQNGTGGFQYSQEEILKDLFNDPRFQQLFQGVLREFQQSGFRASPHFIRKSFFGGKGGMVFGGLFFLGSLAGPHLMRSAAKSLPKQKSLLKTVAHSVGTLLGNRHRSEPDADPTPQPPAGSDITYITPVTAEELESGKVVQVATTGPDGQELLKIKIPPGSRAGRRLRIRGKGRANEQGRGDLYLVLELKKS
jgi:curved DNA-binding protein